LRAATAGQDSDFHFGQAEFCTLARYNNVRAQSELEASPEGEPLHCGDYGLGAIHDGAPVFLHITRHDLDRSRFGHFADIGAGRKGNVRSRHNDATHLAVDAAAGDLVGKPPDDAITSKDALAEGINEGAALGDAVPPAVKSSVVVADDSVVP
jgi:hypothetical protein